MANEVNSQDTLVMNRESNPSPCKEMETTTATSSQDNNESAVGSCQAEKLEDIRRKILRLVEDKSESELTEILEFLGVKSGKDLKEFDGVKGKTSKQEATQCPGPKSDIQSQLDKPIDSEISAARCAFQDPRPSETCRHSESHSYCYKPRHSTEQGPSAKPRHPPKLTYPSLKNQTKLSGELINAKEDSISDQAEGMKQSEESKISGEAFKWDQRRISEQLKDFIKWKGERISNRKKPGETAKKLNDSTISDEAAKPQNPKEAEEPTSDKPSTSDEPPRLAESRQAAEPRKSETPRASMESIISDMLRKHEEQKKASESSRLLNKFKLRKSDEKSDGKSKLLRKSDEPGGKANETKLSAELKISEQDSLDAPQKATYTARRVRFHEHIKHLIELPAEEFKRLSTFQPRHYETRFKAPVMEKVTKSSEPSCHWGPTTQVACHPVDSDTSLKEELKKICIAFKTFKPDFLSKHLDLPGSLRPTSTKLTTRLTKEAKAFQPQKPNIDSEIGKNYKQKTRTSSPLSSQRAQNFSKQNIASPSGSEWAKTFQDFCREQNLRFASKFMETKRKARSCLHWEERPSNSKHNEKSEDSEQRPSAKLSLKSCFFNKLYYRPRASPKSELHHNENLSPNKSQSKCLTRGALDQEKMQISSRLLKTPKKLKDLVGLEIKEKIKNLPLRLSVESLRRSPYRLRHSLATLNLNKQFRQFVSSQPKAKEKDSSSLDDILYKIRVHLAKLGHKSTPSPSPANPDFKYLQQRTRHSANADKALSKEGERREEMDEVTKSPPVNHLEATKPNSGYINSKNSTLQMIGNLKNLCITTAEAPAENATVAAETLSNTCNESDKNLENLQTGFNNNDNIAPRLPQQRTNAQIACLIETIFQKDVPGNQEKQIFESNSKDSLPKQRPVLKINQISARNPSKPHRNKVKSCRAQDTATAAENASKDLPSSDSELKDISLDYKEIDSSSYSRLLNEAAVKGYKDIIDTFNRINRKISVLMKISKINWNRMKRRQKAKSQISSLSLPSLKAGSKFDNNLELFIFNKLKQEDFNQEARNNLKRVCKKCKHFEPILNKKDLMEFVEMLIKDSKHVECIESLTNYPFDMPKLCKTLNKALMAEAKSKAKASAAGLSTMSSNKAED